MIALMGGVLIIGRDWERLKMRPSWDEYFMEITSVVAQRSTCLRRKVGALLVKDKHILASGYNLSLIHI